MKESGSTPWDERAAEAARSVRAYLAGRFAGIPGTYLGRTAYPETALSRAHWTYWWQAHLVDCLVDEACRSLRVGELSAARTTVARADALIRTIRLRNLGRWTNRYYDDMAWLVLAAGRLRRVHAQLGHRMPAELRSLDRAITAALVSADTPLLGGGLFWTTARDFKNVPATAPAAIHFARIGDTDRAARLVDWLYDRLRDGDTGLFLDGIRIETAPGAAVGDPGSTSDGTSEGISERVVTDIYSYNQGTVLGALLALGDDRSRERAEALVEAIAAHLSLPADPSSDTPRTLATHGDGDGGLFTGIEARYLAAAATSPLLSEQTRSLAGDLVVSTATALWTGADPRAVVGGRVTAFSPDPRVPAYTALPAGEASIELSSQLQAWMTLEAAARVAASSS